MTKVKGSYYRTTKKVHQLWLCLFTSSALKEWLLRCLGLLAALLEIECKGLPGCDSACKSISHLSRTSLFSGVVLLGSKFGPFHGPVLYCGNSILCVFPRALHKSFCRLYSTAIVASIRGGPELTAPLPGAAGYNLSRYRTPAPGRKQGPGRRNWSCDIEGQ
jgi:hypothetical protein